jgi:hypothetical protein
MAEYSWTLVPVPIGTTVNGLSDNITIACRIYGGSAKELFALMYPTGQQLPFFLLTVVIKVKVKVTLEQATKAQRGGRGIALLCP